MLTENETILSNALIKLMGNVELFCSGLMTTPGSLESSIEEAEYELAKVVPCVRVKESPLMRVMNEGVYRCYQKAVHVDKS